MPSNWLRGSVAVESVLPSKKRPFEVRFGLVDFRSRDTGAVDAQDAELEVARMCQVQAGELP